MCILVVDDEPEIRRVVESILTTAGHQTMGAEDALEAMQLLINRPGEFTCLVSDFHMGIGPNGSELIEMVREAYPTLPCILVTGGPDAVDAEWQIEKDVGLITKPFSRAHLANAVRERLYA